MTPTPAVGPATDDATGPLARPGAAAFLRACALDVAVRKPGNVSAASPGHGMHAALFLASAEAACAGLFAAGARVGERIEAAVIASLAVAGCNTNLGIVLLCAPLALAMESGRPLRAALQGVLAGLDQGDAAAAFRAIAAARPGGLGRVATEDVSAPPTGSLLQAMTLAAPRDCIARQYANGFAELWEVGLAALHALPAAATLESALMQTHQRRAVQAVYMAYLGRFPDSHIARKFGLATAEAVALEAAPWLARAEQGQDLGQDPTFAAWDESLKSRGLNPGTSADLTVATLFIADALADAASTQISASP